MNPELRAGQLYVVGDAACEQGDFALLGAVAQELLEEANEPQHCELAPLARACRDPIRAPSAWQRLKERLEPQR